MKKTKGTFFILPGFGQNASSKEYLWLNNFLKSRGFHVIKVPIKWEYKTNTKISENFREFYEKHKSPNKNYILGFSYGAVITLMTTKKLQPDKIYLCSLSPDFREDSLAMNPQIKRIIGKRRFDDTKTRSGRKLASELKTPVVIFFGEEEAKMFPQIKIRSQETARLANKSKLIFIKNTPHKIDHQNYIEAIKKEVSKL